MDLLSVCFGCDAGGLAGLGDLVNESVALSNELYLNLFLFVFIPVVLILAFGVPIAVVHVLNKRALQEEAQANEEQPDKPADK